jgi:hypothetical protein
MLQSHDSHEKCEKKLKNERRPIVGIMTVIRTRKCPFGPNSRSKLLESKLSNLVEVSASKNIQLFQKVRKVRQMESSVRL